MNKAELQKVGEEELNEHLRGFISSFIHKDYRQRWMTILLKTPEKARKEMVRFPTRFDERYCTPITSDITLLEAQAKIWRTVNGLYFDGTLPASRMTIGDAQFATWERCADGIFSVEAGRKAIFFFHENLAWKCEK